MSEPAVKLYIILTARHAIRSPVKNGPARYLALIVWLVTLASPAGALEPIPDKLVVLIFDDSAKSHFTVARPLLKRLGFGATFFITEGFDFRDNKRDYMTWDEIAQLHHEGFEIGNHTRDHQPATKGNLRDFAAQVRGINARCREHGIPSPVSFAYPGNGFDLGALPILREQGITFARRGGLPEYSYQEGRGFAFEPGRDHALLIPSAGDARPTWTLKDFRQAVDYDTKTAEEVVRILSSKSLDFRGGLVGYWEPKWSTTLFYGGDTDALNGLLADLRKVPGFRIEVSFSKDLVRESGTGLPAGSWWVQYSHVKRNTLRSESTWRPNRSTRSSSNFGSRRRVPEESFDFLGYTFGRCHSATESAGNR
jgi:peptidoglycan/xylan/chitin deacetylase (PgdA/CDA1 family)